MSPDPADLGDPSLCGCRPSDAKTPVVANRPGLPALEYRIGTHGSFLNRMLRRIALWSPPEDQTKRPLSQLTTRTTGDPAIALLDAWATVGDVLTFYQERIANEGFLRTAIERRSILELARQIGYELNPGVAAEAYLVFEVEGRFVVQDQTPTGMGPLPQQTVVPSGTKVTSLPGQGEQPQTFETREALTAREDWNRMRPRLTTKQPVGLGSTVLYIAGIATGFERGDRVLITAGPRFDPKLKGVDLSLLEVLDVQPEVEWNRTRLGLAVLQKLPPRALPPAPTTKPPLKNPDFDPPDEPDPEPVKPAVIKEAEWGMVPRPLTAGEIAERIAAFMWTEAQLHIQLALMWWNPDVVKKYWDHVRRGPDLGPVYEYKQIAPAQDATRPHVLDIRPKDGTGNVHPNPRIIVSFSEPMDKASAEGAVTLHEGTQTGTRFVPNQTLYDEVTGSVVMIPDTSPDVDPKNFLKSETTYFVVVKDTAKDKNGLAVAGETVSSFTAKDYTGPVETTSARVPKPGATLVDPRTQVKVTFQEDLDPATVTPTTVFLRDGTGTVVAANVELIDNNTTIRLTPRAPLALSTRYTATLTEDVTDPGGNAIALLEWEFATQPRALDVPRVSKKEPIRVYRFREKVGFFGHNAPKWSSIPKPDEKYQRGKDPYPNSWDDPQRTVWVDSQGSSLGGDSVYLDREVRGIDPKSWVMFETAAGAAVYYVSAAGSHSVADYGMAGRATRLQLSQQDGNSPSEGSGRPADFRVREAAAYVDSEPLTLVELPIETPLMKGDTEIVLDTIVFGLTPGKRVALHGMDLDLAGIFASEILVLKEVLHIRGFTTLVLGDGLRRSYIRQTVTLNANVVAATHGETVPAEILGGGDGSQANQRFTLTRAPLTYVSDPTPSGAASTLEVRVDGVRWDESPVLYGLGPRSRRYIVRRDDEGKTSIVFGDGERGARPPTGTENLVARYRSGIGNAGMLGAERLTMLRDRPLGIASVTNPLPAFGAAEPENRDGARENAPLTVLTMERIVSLRDFEDFARGFAGIGKAQAIDLWRGDSRQVHVTVAAADGQEIPKGTPLYENLDGAIKAARDPEIAVEVASFALRYFDVGATVRVDPAYRPGDVLDAVRGALLTSFSFAHRSFGQPVTAAEVIEIAQGVPGVVATYLLEFAQTSQRPPRKLARRIKRAPIAPVLFVQRARVVGNAVAPAELLLINPASIEVLEHAP